MENFLEICLQNTDRRMVGKRSLCGGQERRHRTDRRKKMKNPFLEETHVSAREYGGEMVKG